MVFDPSRPKGPTTVPNSYILTVAANADFHDMVNDIDALVKKEGLEKDVQWGRKMSTIGVAMLKCDDAFAAKVQALPRVGSVEKEHIVHIQKKKHGGPSL